MAVVVGVQSLPQIARRERTVPSQRRERAAGAADAAVERIRNLNERIMEGVRQGGETALEAYERTLKIVAEYQESAGKRGPEWVSGLAKAQAAFTRELASASPAAARALRDFMEELTGAATRQTRRAPRTRRPEPAASGAASGGDDVPIANYDKLNAADVGKRVPRLSKADLDKVEAYERRHKNRKTVLERIAGAR
jgi:rhamnose utilization protein RhaD (predicted bifunctional aldolase and dehydrogenase)